MKKLIFLIALFQLLPFIKLQAGKELTFPIYKSGDSCQFGPKIFLLDNNNDNRFDIFLYAGCPQKAKVFSLIDNSINTPTLNETAIMLSGSIPDNNFLIYLIDSNSGAYTHKIYYDYQYSGVILEDYSGSDNQIINNEEADEYFYSRQIGSLLIITKKKDIDVQSIMMCNIEGMILFNYPHVSGWTEFTFVLSEQPSGVYLIRFIATDKALTKRVIYIK